MQWAEVIASILKVLGPILSDLLKKWLDGKLKSAAMQLDPTGQLGTDTRWLLERVHESLWFFEVRRKRFVAEAIRTAPALVAGLPVGADRMAALAEAATNAA